MDEAVKVSLGEDSGNNNTKNEGEAIPLILGNVRREIILNIAKQGLKSSKNYFKKQNQDVFLVSAATNENFKKLINELGKRTSHE